MQDVPVKLTGPQKEELTRLLRGRQHTYGSSRTRVQNTLVRLGLARYVEDDLCEISDLGAAHLKKQP